MRYKLVGVDKETGLETSVIVDASSKKLARAMGEAKGIIVVSCAMYLPPALPKPEETGRSFAFKCLAVAAVLGGFVFLASAYADFRNDPTTDVEAGRKMFRLSDPMTSDYRIEVRVVK
jgi:hypothetical protein